MDAVAVVCERLEREAAIHGARKAYVNASELASELRSILAFNAPPPKSIVDRALIELGEWSTRHVAAGVGADMLVGAVLSEATCLHADAGVERAEHVQRCEQVWDAVTAARAELAEQGGCGEADCGACKAAGRAPGAEP